MAGTGASYQVIFSEMNQRNSRTGFTREVKREVGASTKCDENWSWNRNSRWELLPLRVRLQMVASRDRRSENTTAARIEGELYTINSARMVVVNKRTGEQHRLRREAGGSLLPMLRNRASRNQASGARGGTTTRLGRSRASARTSSGASSAVASAGILAAASSTGTVAGVGGSGVTFGHDQEADFQEIILLSSDCTSSIGSDEICAVCMDGFSAQEPALLLPRCQGHYIHGSCALTVFRSLGAKCPTCLKIYVEMVDEGYGIAYLSFAMLSFKVPRRGDDRWFGDWEVELVSRHHVTWNQPDGDMSVTRHDPGRMPLSGHETVGTFMIQYRFPGGVQGPKHPNPGQSFRGTTRQAYLPDNEEGREVLELLRKSFNRKMTFTLGTSITTGLPNSIVWNGVHHKTRVSGGAAHYGYPDSTYFARVKTELAAKGIK